MNQIQNNDITSYKKVKSSVWVWLILILIIAAFFRLWRIESMPPGLYPDEAMNGNNTLEALETGEFKIFYPENNGREGLFINIQAVFLAIFGNKPWALRLPSAVFGILTVLGVYFLTKELFDNEKIALIAGFFLATSFWHINFSRIGFRAIMAPFFLVWALYFLLSALRQIQKQKSPIFYILYSIFAGLIYGLGFYSYIAYRITPLLIIAAFFIYWFQNKEREIRKKFLFSIFYFLFSAVVVILPLAYYFFIHPQDFFGRTAQVSIFSTENPLAELGKNILKTLGMFWYRGDYNWRHNYSGAPQLWWPIGILFALGIFIILFRIFKFQITNFPEGSRQIGTYGAGNFQTNSNDLIFKQKKIIKKFKIKNSKLKIHNNILPELFLIFWLFVGLLPVIISSEGLPHALRTIIVLPAVMIISALGLEWLIAAIKNWLENQKLKYPAELKKLNRIQKELLLLLFVFLGAVIGNNYNQYFLRWANHPDVYNGFNQNYVDIGDYLNYLPKDLPKYVIVNAPGVDVRGIPMPSQTVMFITKTFLPKWQKEKNIRYLTLSYGNSIPVLEKGCARNCVITMLENEPLLRQELKEKIPELKIDASPGFVVLKK